MLEPLLTSSFSPSYFLCEHGLATPPLSYGSRTVFREMGGGGTSRYAAKYGLYSVIPMYWGRRDVMEERDSGKRKGKSRGWYLRYSLPPDLLKGRLLDLCGILKLLVFSPPSSTFASSIILCPSTSPPRFNLLRCVASHIPPPPPGYSIEIPFEGPILHIYLSNPFIPRGGSA